MSLDIGTALRDGASRTTERNAVALMVAFVVLALATAVVMQSFYAWYFDWMTTLETTPPGFEQPTMPLALSLPVGVTLGLWLVLAVGAEAVRIVAVRTLVSDETDGIPAEFVTRNLPLAVLNGFFGGIVVGTLIAIGSLFLLIPGIFLAISFYFVRQRIAVEDENFVTAMVRSWELTEGDRIELAVLGLVLVAVGMVVALPTAGLQLVLDGSSPIPQVLQALVRGPVAVFGVAVTARAYVQLADDDTAEPVEEPETGGDDEEWPDPPGVDV